jgi:outer membrane protein TolC
VKNEHDELRAGRRLLRMRCQNNDRLSIATFRRPLIFFLGILIALPGLATAQVRVITLDEAWQITLQNNRDIQKAEEFRNKVMGIYVEQRAAALPQLTATGTSARAWDQAVAATQSFQVPGTAISVKASPDVTDMGVSVRLNQVLFTWGQIGAAIKAAKFGIASAEDQLRLYRQAALRDVSVALYDVLLAKEYAGIARQNLQQKTAHLDEARRKFTAGVATEYDVLSGEVAVENARPETIRTENLVKTTRERVRYILGIPEEIEVNGDLQASLEAPPTYDKTLGTAYRYRPELADLKSRLGYTQEFVKIAQAENKPRVDLKATGGYRALSPGNSEFDGKTWSLGVNVTFPFFDGFRTKGRVMQAKSDVSTLKIEEAKALDSIGLQVRDSVNAVADAANIVKALSGTVSQAERLLSMAEKGYEYGVKTNLEVDDAQLNLVQARGSLARAKRDYLAARVILTWAMGVLGEETRF